METKWSVGVAAPPVVQNRTPDRDHVTLEQYQQSLALMNADLTDIQADIQKLATQQNQIQAQTIQAQQLLQVRTGFLEFEHFLTVFFCQTSTGPTDCQHFEPTIQQPAEFGQRHLSASASALRL